MGNLKGVIVGYKVKDRPQITIELNTSKVSSIPLNKEVEVDWEEEDGSD